MPLRAPDVPVLACEASEGSRWTAATTRRSVPGDPVAHILKLHKAAVDVDDGREPTTETGVAASPAPADGEPCARRLGGLDPT
jgi:hypothetical protein